MSQPIDDALKNMDKAIDEIEEVLHEDNTILLSDLPANETRDPEESALHNAQITPPSVHDEQTVVGTQPVPNGDDVDEIGRDMGLEYKEDEELNVAQKVPVVTPAEPPKPEKPVS